LNGILLASRLVFELLEVTFMKLSSSMKEKIPEIAKEHE